MSLKIPGRRAIYELRAVIVYTQLTPSLAHYSAFIQSPKDNQWFYVDDTKVIQENYN